MNITSFNPLRSPVFWRRGGFTLVEMLVVIAIIMVLAALLLPALERIGQRADQVKCMNNMRQIGMAMITYASDNKGRMPVRGYAEAVDFANPSAPTNWLAQILPLLGGDKRILVCPSVTENNPLGQYAVTALSTNTYLANAVALDRTLLSIPKPGSIVMLQEYVTRVGTMFARPTRIELPSSPPPYSYRAWYYKSVTYGEHYSNNHSGGGNLIFCDGRGEWRHRYDLRSGDFGLTPPDEKYNTPNGPNDFYYYGELY
jgi:prepilin-type N-terminal cleavage/methylation domain-containing protein/prepilin-type processing-associated H-X9-DG protein